MSRKLKLIMAIGLASLVIVGSTGWFLFDRFYSNEVKESSETPNETPPVGEENNPDSTQATAKEEENKTQPEIKDVPISYNEPFQWGVTMRPNGIANYSASGWQDQINKAKELGVGWVRLQWDYHSQDRNTPIVDALRSAGLGVVLVIEHNPALGTSHMYQDGLNDGKNIAGRFKGKIKYYQLANEGGAQSIKNGTMTGINPSDYDPAEYARVRDYIKGLSEGINSVDGSAYKIVTISWLHTGFLDKLVADGVKFDMIGVDWYSWMGSFGSRQLTNGVSLYSKLKSFGKAITFMEVNILPKAEDATGKRKTIVDETQQANFITSTASWAWSNRNYVKGFFVLELVDNINVSGEYVDYYGLLKAVRSTTGAGMIGEARKAFSAYRDLIKSR